MRMGRRPRQGRTEARPAFGFLVFIALLLVGIGLCYSHSRSLSRESAGKESIRRSAVAVVGSADLSIDNAARFIRHVSLTDVATPFQDCPGCFDYFPEAISVNPPGFAGYVTRFEVVKP